ncbi:hypothetical protein CBR_g22019 [Chara braunii]|uniref:Uncharacterized protein n=1 Tax=Chara braunii TaxID=69332 RepID=A0A388L1V1_CHABU|nr:hypothetical protein CBR_g22019 [Chara braunii]|eukprot:GBG76271.1 hypothetical protein CBR_g22019 [Chara braunii]
MGDTTGDDLAIPEFTAYGESEERLWGLYRTDEDECKMECEDDVNSGLESNAMELGKVSNEAAVEERRGGDGGGGGKATSGASLSGVSQSQPGSGPLNHVAERNPASDDHDDDILDESFGAVEDRVLDKQCQSMASSPVAAELVSPSFLHHEENIVGPDGDDDDDEELNEEHTLLVGDVLELQKIGTEDDEKSDSKDDEDENCSKGGKDCVVESKREEKKSGVQNKDEGKRAHPWEDDDNVDGELYDDRQMLYAKKVEEESNGVGGGEEQAGDNDHEHNGAAASTAATAAAAADDDDDDKTSDDDDDEVRHSARGIVVVEDDD